MNNKNFGRYKIIKLIASGGMADVYKAVMTGPHNFEKTVAFKMIHEQLICDPAFVRMFTDEARISAKLVHPNIVQIVDFGEIDKRLYITMEYVDGIDLSRFIHGLISNAIDPQMEISVYIITEILNAIAYTCKLKDTRGEGLGIVHRDITPQNILLSYEGDVKLTDFGIAKVRGSITTTTAGTLKGKIRYMSPEQARGEVLDHRSDLYSTALVLYELITHKQAYSGDTDMILLRQVQSANIEHTPLQLNPSIPYSLNDIVIKALSPAPSDRFYDPASFKKALEHYMHDSGSARELLSEHLNKLFSVQAYEDSRHTRMTGDNKQDKKRDPGLLYIAGVICLVILMVSTMVFVQYKKSVHKNPAASPIIPYSGPYSGTSNPFVIPKVQAHDPVPVEHHATEHKQPASAAHATLVINAIPWAKVYIVDHGTEKYAGPTPLSRLQIPSGAYTLIFKNRLYGTRTVKIKVSSGEKKTVILKYDRHAKRFMQTIR